jgi:NAD(P)-dependent dehydrogenase (short-subunit alcohol dehydrogenase family)
MDMASLESVRKGAAEIRQLTEKLNVAVFNAG